MKKSGDSKATWWAFKKGTEKLIDHKEWQKPSEKHHARLDRQKAYPEKRKASETEDQRVERFAQKRSYTYQWQRLRGWLNVTYALCAHVAHAHSQRLTPTMFYIRLVHVYNLYVFVWVCVQCILYIYKMYMYMYMYVMLAFIFVLLLSCSDRIRSRRPCWEPAQSQNQ